MKIALAQINPTVGDFTGNLEKIVAATAAPPIRARASQSSLNWPSAAILPPTSLKNPASCARCRTAVDELAAATRDLPTALLPASHCLRRRCRKPGSRRRVFVAGVEARRQRRRASRLAANVLLEQHKRLLPFYDVFDEQRYFLARRTASRWSSSMDCASPSPFAKMRGTTRISGRAASTRRSRGRADAPEPAPSTSIFPPRLSGIPSARVRRQMLAAIARRDGIPVLMCEPGGRQRQPHLRRLLARAQCARRADRAGRILRGRSGGRRSLQRCPNSAIRPTTTPKPPIAPWSSAPAITCANAASAKSLSP